jgi:hypothetical protein
VVRQRRTLWRPLRWLSAIGPPRQRSTTTTSTTRSIPFTAIVSALPCLTRPLSLTHPHAALAYRCLTFAVNSHAAGTPHAGSSRSRLALVPRSLPASRDQQPTDRAATHRSLCTIKFCPQHPRTLLKDAALHVSFLVSLAFIRPPRGTLSLAKLSSWRQNPRNTCTARPPTRSPLTPTSAPPPSFH